MALGKLESLEQTIANMSDFIRDALKLQTVDVYYDNGTHYENPKYYLMSPTQHEQFYKNTRVWLSPETLYQFNGKYFSSTFQEIEISNNPYGSS